MIYPPIPASSTAATSAALMKQAASHLYRATTLHVASGQQAQATSPRPAHVVTGSKQARCIAHLFVLPCGKQVFKSQWQATTDGPCKIHLPAGWPAQRTAAAAAAITVAAVSTGCKLVDSIPDSLSGVGVGAPVRPQMAFGHQASQQVHVLNHSGGIVHQHTHARCLHAQRQHADSTRGLWVQAVQFGGSIERACCLLWQSLVTRQATAEQACHQCVACG